MAAGKELMIGRLSKHQRRSCGDGPAPVIEPDYEVIDVTDSDNGAALPSTVAKFSGDAYAMG
jgi:hypothetical protein